MVRSREDKAVYFERVRELIQTYKSVFLVNIDNVSSNQMHQIRRAIRGRGFLIMGKNTLVRRAFRLVIGDYPDYERLLPYIKGNVGLVFTNEDLKEIRDLLINNRVSAPARAGAIAPADVFVPPGNTGMEPGKTSFFQALNIPTKIARGTIEIVSEIQVLQHGAKVSASEASLLNMLNISPFTYGMVVELVFDNGQIFEPSVLDVSNEELVERFQSGIQQVASISLAVGYPTLASVMHSLVNSYKNVLNASLATEYTFWGSEKSKEYLANPEAFAVAAAPAAAGGAAAAAPAEEKKEEPAEESDEDMGFGLFD